MKLYKKDSKGKIRELDIFAENADIVQVSGLIDGKKVEHRTTCKPKNIGKSNETTAIEQAKSEVINKITKKIKEEYFSTIEEAKSNEVILPMLAKSYKDQEKNIDWRNAYVQPKLDGMRGLDIKDKGKISRKNTPIDTLNHIKVDTSKYIIDGEYYAHGLNFQENMRAIKKHCSDTKLIKHHVYDLISDKPFIERYEKLKEVVNNSTNLELVPTYKVSSLQELKVYHSTFLEEGYEGTILRWGDAPYKINGRSANLLKYKDFKDIACKIVNIGPAKKRPTWARPVVEWQGKTFSCGIKVSHKEREKMLINKNDYIGKVAEIRYFEESEDGIPRFPIMVGVRLDK